MHAWCALAETPLEKRLAGYVDELEAKLAEMEKAIPDTFYAGADLIFRQAQLVRIWGNAIKANVELEAEVARLLRLLEDERSGKAKAERARNAEAAALRGGK